MDSASRAIMAKTFKKLHVKLVNANGNIWFNTQCKKKGIIPNYIKIQTAVNTPASQKAKKKAESHWLQNEQRHWFQVRDNLFLSVYRLHTQLAETLHPIELDQLLDKVSYHSSRIKFKKMTILKNKLSKLSFSQNISPIPKCAHIFHPRIKNLTCINFSEPEKKLLEKGLSYAPKNCHLNNSYHKMALDVETALSFNPNVPLQSHCIHILDNFLKSNNFCTSNTESNALFNIKRKIKDHDLLVTKADKGNTVVIMYKSEYFKLTEEFLKENNFTIIKKDPTNKVNKKVREEISKIKIILNDKEKMSLINPNPQPPRLYGLPKIHKPTLTIRPIVSNSYTPTDKLAKRVNQIFRNKTKFKPKFTVNNSNELINEIKNVHLPNNCKLVSFDVTNLFTNIPPKECLQLIRSILDKNATIPILEKEELYDLFQCCLNQNYFKFNNNFYTSENSLSMGSSLSPLLADIFMDNFEDTIFNSNNSLLKHILYWKRYVDDILCLWTGTDRQINQFLNYINSLHNKIKFTLELEVDHSINFLDLTITHKNNYHSFKIYRKPTQTDATIHFNSNHHFSHKLAAYHQLVERLIKVPMSDEDYKAELDTIKYIAFQNGYDTKIVDKILKKKIQRNTIIELFPINPPKKSPAWLSLTYNGILSHKISKAFSKFNYNTSFKNINNLKQILVRNKDTIDSMDCSGVYKITCQTCQSEYVGQTRRNFNIRIAEHIRCWKSSNPNYHSSFAEHLKSSNHLFDPSDTQILHIERNWKKLNILEQFEIHKSVSENNTLNLNDQINLPVHPILNFLKHRFPPPVPID